MGSRGDTGAALARLRQMRSGFNANQLKEASERWTRCRESWRDEREHATCARALEVLASRAAEGVRAKGAPSRGGPVRAEVAAVLRAAQTTDAIAAIVASPSPAAARVACRSLDALLGIVSAANATRPSAPLIAALATRVAHDPAIADADTALAAASSLRRLATAPGALDDSAVADALRAARAAPAFAARLVRFAELGETAGRHALPFSAVAPAAVAAAALASRRDFWDFLEDAGVETGTTAAALAEALAAAAARAARERRFDVAGAAMDAAAALASRREAFRLALCRPEARLARAIAACVEGVGFREADAQSPAVSAASAAAFHALAAAARDLPAPGDCADWRRVVEALVRAVAAHAECARARDAADAAAASRRAAAATATAAAAALLRPRRRVYGAPSPPPPPWRAALLGAGVAAALRESTSAWADAGVANRGLAAVANAFGDSGLGAVSGVGNGWVGFGSTEREWTRAGPAHAWCAAERLAVSGETPEMRAEDAEALARSALMTVALVAPPSTRREQVVSSILAASSGPIRHAEIAPPPLVACAGAGARDAAAEAAAAAAGRALCAFLECAATRAAATRALDETRDLLGGDEWTRCVGRHLSLGVGATPAKACLAAALARTPSGRAALGESGAAARVAATLVELASAARAAAERRRRAGVCGEAGAGAEDDAADDAADCSFSTRERAGFADERKRFGRGGDSNAEDAEEEASWFAPFRWRAGDAALVAASLRALVELVAPPVFDSRGEGRDGKDFFEAAGRSAEASGAARDPNVTRHKYPVSPSRRETAASLPPALAATLGALASEEGAASLGDDETADSIRCWSLLACSCVGADACEGGVGGAARVAAALLEALPEPNAESSEFGSALPVAPPDVCFVLADGTRQPAHGALLAARCPSLLARAPPGGEAAAESRGDFLRSAPAPTIRLGAGVTRRALRATLRWAYSGALPFPADVSDGLFLSRDGGDGEAADEGSARNALAKLASKCGAYELAHTTRFRRPKPGARVRRLTEALEALMTSGEGYADVLLRAETNASGPDDRLDERSSRRFPAHRVVLCARAEYFRAALDPARGFLESRPLKARDADARRETRCPSLAFPFAATEEALAAALRAAYAGAAPRVDARRAREKKEKKTFAFGATYDDIDTENVSATTAVHLAASLEYLMLDREAEACASRVAHAARARDWRERLGGVSGALAALAAAAAARRWAELEALLGAVAAVYPEAAETEPEALEAVHPDLREAMRRAHVQQTRAR